MTKGEWIMAEGHELPDGGIKRVSKEPQYFSKTLTRGKICKQMNVDSKTLAKMVKAGEVVLR